jgi:hypothetical protein
LEKLQDITIEIKEHMEYHNKIQKEVNDINKQKQEISIQCQIAITLINTINNKISYIKGFRDHYKDFNDKTNLPSRFLLYLFSLLCIRIQEIMMKAKKMEIMNIRADQNNNL